MSPPSIPRGHHRALLAVPGQLSEVLRAPCAACPPSAMPRGDTGAVWGGDTGAARPQRHRTVPRSVSVSWGRGTRGWSRGAGQEEGRAGCPLRPQRVPLRRALHMPVNFTPSALDGSLVIFGELSHKFVPPHCSNLLSGDGRAPLRSASRVPRGRGHPRAHRGRGYPKVHGLIPAQIPQNQGLAELWHVLGGDKCAGPSLAFRKPRGIPVPTLKHPLARSITVPFLPRARSHQSPSLFQAMRLRRTRR